MLFWYSVTTCIGMSMLERWRWMGTDFIAGQLKHQEPWKGWGVHRALDTTHQCCCPTLVKTSAGIQNLHYMSWKLVTSLTIFIIWKRSVPEGLTKVLCGLWWTVPEPDTSSPVCQARPLVCLPHQHRHLSRDWAVWMGESLLNLPHPW